MELFETIETRRAVRDFTDARVDRQVLDRLIDAAIQAPSAMNLQPWAFFVVDDAAALRRISGAAKKYLLDAMKPTSALATYRHHLADPGFDILHSAPVLIVICSDSAAETEATRPAEDCCLAAENLMLAACGLGLGTCWVGFARPWLSTSAAKAELGMPQAWTPVAPIVVGHPRAVPAPVPRKAPQVRWYGADG